MSRLRTGYYKTPAFARETKAYTDALQHLGNMLSGSERLSIAEAYYQVENAYGDNYLSQKEYDDILNQSAAFIKSWMRENGMDEQDNGQANLAIQKFMGEKLSVNTPIIKLPGDHAAYKMQPMEHLPFFYDYDDYQGEKDYRNYFVTKCLATGGGQCSSMPAVYLSLAEKLGVKAYLSLAPQHSFVKFPDKNGDMENYEPTSNWKISDKWYADNMSIAPEARRSGIYLDTLNRRQIVADCIMSLAAGYTQKFGSADAGFVTNCIHTAAPEFRRPYLQILFVKSAQLARMLHMVTEDNGIRTYEELARSQEASEIYEELAKNEALIKRLGYREAPKELYAALLKASEFKGRMQQQKGIDGKKKRSMFIKR